MTAHRQEEDSALARISRHAVELLASSPDPTDTVSCILDFASSQPGIERISISPQNDAGNAATQPDNTQVFTIPCRYSSPAQLVVHSQPNADLSGIKAILSCLAISLDQRFLIDQAAEATKRADQRISELSAIYDINQAIHNLNINSLLQLITEKASILMDAQACSLLRYLPDTQDLRIEASYGLSEELRAVTRLSIGEGIAGRVAATGKHMLINDAEHDPRLEGLPIRPEIGSSMVVPIKDETEKLHGVLCIRRRRPARNFEESDLSLFRVFANIAALAISNSQLYTDLRLKVDQLSTLSDLSQSILSAYDLNTLLERVADAIINVVGFERCCIFMLDRDTNRYIPRILRGDRIKAIGHNSVRLGEGVIGTAALKKIPVIESDVRTTTQPTIGFARSLGSNSFVLLPVVANNVSIGMVLADNPTSRRPITNETVDLLTAFVNQAAIAMDKAYLYEEMGHRYQEINRLANYTENLLNSVAAGVLSVKLDGTVTTWNRAAEEITGITAEDVCDRPYSELVHKFNLPEWQEALLIDKMRHVLATGERLNQYDIIINPHHRDEITLSLLISPLIENNGERLGAVEVFENMTEQTRMKDEMDRMRRLADIGQLASTIAHDIRNPLSSIRGAAQLFEKEVISNPLMTEYVQMIIQEVDRLNKIATDMLDFAQPTARNYSLIQPSKLVHRVLHMMASEINDSNVCVTYDEEPGIAPIEVNVDQMERAIMNLVLNAIQAMPDGGKLSIICCHLNETHRIAIRFYDTGCGIPPNKIQNVTKPFYTTKTRGSGLGLSIVQKVVEAHNGSLEIDSVVGEGSSISILLPVSPPFFHLESKTNISVSVSDQDTMPDIY